LQLITLTDTHTHTHTYTLSLSLSLCLSWYDSPGRGIDPTQRFLPENTTFTRQQRLQGDSNPQS